MCRCCIGYDVILVLGVSGCFFLPILRFLTDAKIIVNIDGLEYKRSKWNKRARWFLYNSERMAVKYADLIVADNKAIQNYVSEKYGRQSALIAYGGDHVGRDINSQYSQAILEQYGLSKGNYAISVCRVEPENNTHVILEAFSRSDRKLVFVGNWHHNGWAKDIRQKYSVYPNLMLLDAIYDLDILYTLRVNAGVYVHGHSAGGTNPSLVEAMHFGIPILAYDVVYNRETTESKAYYFSDPDGLLNLLAREDLRGNEMKEIAWRRYRWRYISSQYCNLFRQEDVMEFSFSNMADAR